MTPCSACGRIESPLVSGICPACLASPPSSISTPRSALPPSPSASEVPGSPSNSITPPSTFLSNGIVLQFVGLAISLVAAASMPGARSPLAFVGSLAGLAFLFVGGIFLSVGIIRWAIWPLIERRARD